MARWWLQAICHMEAKRSVDEARVIVCFRPENSNLVDSLLAKLGFMLHEKVCECGTVWRA
jgi:hypothetical protein